MARTQYSTEYYDYIDTCYECKQCGAKEYAKRVRTVVGWKSETTAGYGNDGRYHSAESRGREIKIYISDDGYYHRAFDNKRGWCKTCIAKHRKRVFAVIAIIVAVVLALSLLNTAIVSFINSNKGVYEWTYNQMLKKLEGHAEYQADIETDVPGKQIADSIAAQIAEKDFYMHFYDDGSGSVQKYTLGDTVTYFYSFNEHCGELSNTVYIHADDILYVNGEERIAYRNTATEYDALLAKLEAYLPQNYCAKGTYTTEGHISSDKDELYAMIAHGEDCTLLYDSGHGYFYEKTPTLFVRIHFGEDDRMEKLPEITDYRIIE